MAADMGVGVRTALTRDAGRLEIFAAVLDALGREARCVVFEDLHWADEATLDLLAYLGRRIDEARVELARATAHRHVWLVGELSWWLWRAGVAVELPDAAAAVPYALQIAGRWREAATAWRGLACPFEAARSLAEGDADSQLEALSIFEGLGARPAADALRQRLHAAGVRGLVRGPRTATRANPFSLAARELQVLQLLCKGLRNAEIAQQLSRSMRTVDHHLAAVFAKLGVDSRVAAIQAAQRAGLQTPARQSGPPVPPRSASLPRQVPATAPRLDFGGAMPSNLDPVIALLRRLIDRVVPDDLSMPMNRSQGPKPANSLSFSRLAARGPGLVARGSWPAARGSRPGAWGC